jgi:hypothetical protein
MAFVVSLGLAGVLATLMVWTGWWHPVAGYLVLAIPTISTAGFALYGPGERFWGGTPPPPALLGGANYTMLIPAVADRRETSVIPAVRDSANKGARDLGEVQRISLDLEPTSRVVIDLSGTQVIPRVADLDWTSLIPAQGPPLPDLADGHQAEPADPVDPEHPGHLVPEIAIEVGLALGIIGGWLVGLRLSDASSVGNYGLLSVLHPLFFVAVAACVVRFLVELGRPRWRGWVLLGQTALLVVIMHATVPLLIHEPEYAWSYKHVGVVQMFASQGHITNPDDLYEQWPTFFAAVAHLAAGSGVDPLRLAAWAPVFFDLAFCVPIFAVARTLAADPRVPYLTVFLFSAIDWVAQDYLAPQPYAYVMALGSLLVVLRWLRRTARTPTGRLRLPERVRVPDRVKRLWSWVSRGAAPVPYTSNAVSWAATGVLCVVFAVVVAAHQLSPYLIAISAAGLAVVGLVRPLRIVPIMIGICLVYLIPRYQVADDYGLFSGFNLFSNARTAKLATGASDGRLFSVDVVQLLTLTVWGLAALAVVTAWRRPGMVAAPAVLAFIPFGLLAVQSYGGEAIFRVFLFSAPWCAYLIATLLLRRTWVPRLGAVPAGTVAVVLAVLATLQGAHGQLAATTFTRTEVAAAQYLYGHAEPGADIVFAADNFPTRLTANYGQFAYGANADHTLITSDDRLGLFELTPDGESTFNQRFDATVAAYLVFSPSMVAYLRYFGYMPPETLTTLEQLVQHSTHWSLYYRDGDVRVYKFKP